MATSLETKLNAILAEKNEKIISENIKKGVKIFDVEGTLEAGSVVTEGFKSFETIEEMQNDPDAKEGDLAQVVTESIRESTVSDVLSSVMFPETVTLNETITSTQFLNTTPYNHSFSSTYGMNVRLGPTSCLIQYHTAALARYISEDGKTYTRTTDISEYEFNPHQVFSFSIMGVSCNKFILVKDVVSKGFFEYKNTPSRDTYKIGNTTYTIPDLYNNLTINSNDTGPAVLYFDSVDGTVVSTYTIYFTENKRFCVVDGKYCIYNSTVNSTTTVVKVHYDGIDTTVESITIAASGTLDMGITNLDNAYFINTDLLDGTSGSTIVKARETIIENVPELAYVSMTGGTVATGFYRESPAASNYGSTYYAASTIRYLPPLVLGVKEYNLTSAFAGCSNLLEIPEMNLDFITEFNSTFSGCMSCTKFPEITGNRSSGIDMNNTFEYCYKLGPEYTFDCTNVQYMSGTFQNCIGLKTITFLNMNEESNTYKTTNVSSMLRSCSSLETVVGLNLSNATNISALFQYCTSLVDIPELSAPLATNATSMFGNCPNLSDSSLNNILALCLTMVKLSSTNMTLKSIGLTEEQATKCTTLSNWEAVSTSGWTTGY